MLLRVTLLALAILLTSTACSESADPAPCEAGRIRCGDACVDPGSDPSHCGACGTACEEGEVCSLGSCEASCAAPRTDCSGACLDTAADDAHCGGCGQACEEGTVCADGVCVCPAGEVRCGGACTDRLTDDANCGACGIACEEGQRCVEGACACEGGLEACASGCADLATDDANCGGCGVACGDDRSCTDGNCVCDAGLVECDGACIDPDTDAAHCGGCGNGCEVGANATAASCAAGVCALQCAEGWADCDGDVANGCEVALASDVGHCGACGAACGEGAFCEEGSCCQQGATVCGGACVDTASDPAHCGGCGLGCNGWPGSTGGSCLEGACVLACNQGGGDCNLDVVDGCETDLDADAAHCGACGNECGARCGGGSCLSVAFPAKTFHHNCVLHGDGQISCWGWNVYGQLGDGGVANANLPLTVALGGVIELATGEMHSCAILADGGVACWGKNDAGQIGTGSAGTFEGAPRIVQDEGGPLAGATQLALTESSTCALLASGRVKCWGSGLHGRLGNGGTAGALVPGYVLDGTVPLENVVEIAAGLQHVCARLGTGTVSCWGRNNNGQLGLGDSGTGTERLVATALPGLAAVDQVVAAGYRSCARSGGSAYCWGQNLHGQIGDGTQVERHAPTQVVGLTTAAELHIAPNHGCATLTDSTAACWGFNNMGQLGDGTLELRTTPVPVQDVNGATWTDLQQIAAGGAHTCAVDAAHAVHCWGYNAMGQLGDGSTATSGQPLPVHF